MRGWLFPSNLVYFGAKGAFRDILRSVNQKGISQNSLKGGPFGSAGGRIPEKGRPFPPKSSGKYIAPFE